MKNLRIEIEEQRFADSIFNNAYHQTMAANKKFINVKKIK